jgi:hypothetical protein
MDWGDMQVKFAALTAPYLGSRGDTLFALAQEFGRGGTLPDMREILARL